MPKFVFPLQTVLRVRVNERDRCRTALAEELALVHELEVQLLDVDRLLQTLAAESATAIGLVDVAMYQAADRYGSTLRSRRTRLLQTLCERQVEVEARRTELVEADRQVRQLELLQERRLAEFLSNDQRREQRELDEIALARRSSKDYD